MDGGDCLRNTSQAAYPVPGRPSIPCLTFIEFDAVLLTERPKLILIRLAFVMLLLPFHIIDHAIKIRLADREGPVACLPVQRPRLIGRFPCPFGTFRFDVIDEFVDGDRPGDTTYQVNMINPSARTLRKTVQFLNVMTQNSKYLLSKLIILQKRLAVFGAENDVQPNLGQRLWHRHFLSEKAPVSVSAIFG